MARIVRSEGEWAIDYRSREAIARDLAVRLGVSPETYARRTFWWWFGWSIDPAIYAGIYRRATAATARPLSALAPDHYVLITEKAELPAFLATLFDGKGSHAVGGMHVHVAAPKPLLSDTLPSANADTGVRLHPFLQEIDLIRQRPEGFARIGRYMAGNAQRDLFLGFMAEGRIKLLLATEQSQVRGRGRLRWCLDSPSFNGHYQEIKTLWRPRLVLTLANSTVREVRLVRDVLGSLPFKTPRCGETWIEAGELWQVGIAVDGILDQSFMQRPDLAPRQWALDFNAEIRPDSLPQKSISEWLSSRFER
jgi:hypothetical protein